MGTTDIFFDSSLEIHEKLPRKFTITFESILIDSKIKTRVNVDGSQVGDLIDDNSNEKDGYRFHDIFHYSFAAFLGWSPCARAMMKRKRKSITSIDEVEDGARATITEEAISMIIFNEARKNKFFEGQATVSEPLLNQIKELTNGFEVSKRSKSEWKIAILKSYAIFRKLVKNNGGKVSFDSDTRESFISE